MTRGGGNPRRANGHRRDVLRARVLGRGEPCWMCGLPIDASLPNLHPCQGVVDELVPVSQGGSPYDPGNCVAAHRCCNSWRKAKATAVVRRVGTLVEGMGGAASPQEWCAKASVALRALRHGVTSVELAPPRPTTDW